jgi:uncharacterized Ntn-hydrolase superfamily protein
MGVMRPVPSRSATISAMVRDELVDLGALLQRPSEMRTEASAAEAGNPIAVKHMRGLGAGRRAGRARRCAKARAIEPLEQQLGIEIAESQITGI